MSRKFTILGESGSGKTCYLLGMYYEMVGGVGSYSIAVEEIEKGDKLSVDFQALEDESSGMDRFPAITAERESYTLALKYNLKAVNFFTWIDYPGSFLKPGAHEISDAQYREVAHDINTSDVLFICIDGANLIEGDVKKKIRALKKNSARNIIPYLSRFVDNNGKLPPIAMIVTKWDLCKNSTTAQQLQEIIESVFGTLFGTNEETYIVIIPVSLGANIQDDGYRGELEPLNVELPILFGIKAALEKDIEQTEQNAEQAKQNIPQIDNEISECDKKISSLNDDIATRKRWIQSNNNNIAAERNSPLWVNEDKIANWQDENQRYSRQIESAKNDIRSWENRRNDLREQREQNVGKISQKDTIPSMKDFIGKINAKLAAIPMVFRYGAWQQGSVQ